MSGIALKIAFAVLVLSVLIGVGLDHAKPVFDPKVLGQIFEQARNLSTHRINKGLEPLTLNQTMEEIQRLLAGRYPDYIHGIDADRWTSNLAGGFKSGMLLMHGSLTEYVMFYGASLPTTGHSGRSWAEFHDWILSGDYMWWDEGGIDIRPHVAGDYCYTARFQAGVVHLSKNTWMLEYCHGVIPSMLPFGLADSIFSSLDFVNVYRTISIYSSMAIRELFINFKI